MLKKFFVVLSSLLVSLTVFAQSEDNNRSLLITKLENVYQHLAPKDSSKVAVTLRLADLYAERARNDSMNELNQGCTTCKAGEADRKKALRLYTEVLERAPEAVQGKVMVQVGHLYQLTGDEGKAVSFYQKILNEGGSSELKAEAQLSLAEIYFKRREFAKAQGFYQDVLKNASANSRGLAAYRSAWCAFNLGDIASSIKQMETILRTPALLTRNGSNQAQIDPQFQEEVSRDYATFIAKNSTISSNDIESLFKLSPENVRVQNVKSLALDAERIGKKADALKVWTFVFGYMSKPEDRLAAQISMAQLHFDTNNKKAGAESFESAMQLWKELKSCQSNQCDELRRRSRQFVVSWHQLEKKAPTAELLAAYQVYINNFPEDMDMNLYAANVAKELKNWDVAWTYYNKTREMQLKDKDPKTADKLETTLVALLDLAEDSKNEKYETQAYDMYLEQSPKKTKSFEVQYQKAHGMYEKGQYGPASEALRTLALDKKGDAKIRKQAADLSLDALVLMKDETNISTWAAEYAQALSGAGDTKEFTQMVQKAVLTKSATAAGKDTLAAYNELNQFNPSQATPEDKMKFYKNKLILAEKLNKFSEAQGAADSLLQQPGLSEEDREFAWSRKAYMAEMTLDFTTALTATEKLQKGLKPDEKMLKLAMFAELSGQKSASYYGQYLQASKDEENKKLVAAELVRKSKAPEKEIELYRPILGKSPQLMAQLYTEVFAKSSSDAILKKVTKDASMKTTDSGKLLTRVAFLKDFAGFKKQLTDHKLDTKNDRKLAATMKARVALLEKLEGFAKQAIDAGDWTSQLVSVDLLAKESERFYSELLSAPVPQGLSDEEQQQYMQLLSAQATPFQAKSVEAKAKVEEFWKNSKWQPALKASWEQADLRSVIVTEVNALREIAPQEHQNTLADLVVTKKDTTVASQRPSLQEIQKARSLVNKNPFDKQALQALLDLEKKSENTAMTQYLQTRIENLAKSSEKGVL
ncbi:tetratricopeptide repeat protein [Bdellovibrio sp. HCB337]|uniref:tetratricopeptide repeat protein n=1 Tax=Bdellovibrio sp. HCB337 TaxID=3394358 RepID=UPI0039A74C6C